MGKILTIKENILQFIENQRIVKEEFYKKTEISASNFKGSGLKSEIGGDKIVKILSCYPEINPEWLITGNGEMLKKNSIVHTIGNETILYKELAEARLKIIELKDEKIDMLEIIAFKDEKIAALENLISELKYTVSGNPIVYSNVAEPPPELMKKELPNDSPLMQK